MYVNLKLHQAILAWARAARIADPENYDPELFQEYLDRYSKQRRHVKRANTRARERAQG